MKRKKNPNQRAFKIVQNTPIAIARPVEEPIPEVDTAKAVAFAMSIAQEMKRRQQQADEEKTDEERRRPAGRDKQYSQDELMVFRNKLLEIREHITSRSAAMESSVGVEESDDIEPDGGDGTNQTLRLHTMNQLDLTLRTIRQIDEALHQIDEGNYGLCVSCGQPIPRNRLLTSPFVKTCTDCQQALERGA